MTKISEDTTVSLGLVIIIASGCLSLGGLFWMVKAQAADIEDLKKDQKLIYRVCVNQEIIAEKLKIKDLKPCE